MQRAAFVVASLCAAAGSAVAAPQFWNLGAGYEPSGISDTGVVVGTDTFANQYFSWNAIDGVALIGGVGGNDGYGGQATITNDGSRVGGTNINNDTGKGEIAIYDTGSATWTNLGGIGGTIDNSTSSGWGISGDGQTLVGLGWTAGLEARAISWTQGSGLAELSMSGPSAYQARANSTNFDGSVIGGWEDNDNGRQGSVWVNGAQELLFDTNGFAVSEALSISDDGVWVTGVSYGTMAPYRYNTVTDVLEYLPDVSAFYDFPTALGTAISNDGSTIIGQVRDFGPPLFYPGFIWQDGQGAMTLNEYFDAVGVPYEPGFFFSIPLAMSGDGLTMAGYGISPTDGVVGWVVTVPTPASVFVLGIGGLIGSRRTRR